MNLQKTEGCADRGSVYLFGSIIMLSVTLVSGLMLSSYDVSADDDTAIDEVNISIPVSCSLSGTGMNTHTATMDPNTYNDGVNHAGIGSTTLTAYCNDPNGFAIYAVGYTNDEVGNTDLEGTTTSYTIPTGTATSGATSNWSMKLASVSGTYAPIIAGSISDTEKQSGDPDYSTFVEVPDDYERVAYRTAGTDIGQSAVGSQLTTSYAVFVSGTQAPDTYVGQVLYTLVHPYDEDPPAQPQPSTAGYITYYANASNAVGTMDRQGTYDGATITLFASNFSRDGYGFAGWSDAYDYATNANAHFYGPHEQITVPIGTTANGLALYAVWIKSEGNLQDSNKVSSVCNRLTQSGPNITKTLASVSALTDQRDNETYAIAKLADGNCWMIENLRLENTNSDNSTGSLAQGYGTSTTYGNFVGLAEPEAANFTSTSGATDATTENSLYYAGTQSGTATINISQTNFAGYRMPRYNHTNTDSSTRANNPSSNNANIYSYGNYYTWAAALANTNYFSTYDSVDENNNTSEASNTSICPRGWVLPYGLSTGNGATSGGFSYLDIQLGGNGREQNPSSTNNVWRSFPNNFLISGNAASNSTTNKGNVGYYWSSTSLSNTSGRILSIYYGGLLRPGVGADSKYLGISGLL